MLFKSPVLKLKRGRINIIELNEEHKLQGEKEAAILFEEADSIFVKSKSDIGTKGATLLN